MISIIGAGPVGNFLAYNLAKQGKKVSVYEDHKKIGLPIQCTGIITPELHSFMKINSKFVVNKIAKAKIYAPNGESIIVKFQREDIIVNRTKFDAYLGEMAKKEGVKYHLGHRYKSNDGKTLHINDKHVKTDVLVGADGPLSRVAKNNGLWCDRKSIIGNQVTVEADAEDRSMMEIWLGIGLFSWFVPEAKGLARVGTMSYDKPTEHLNQLINLRCPKAKIVSRQPGHIPIYNPKQKVQKDFVYLIGDAAGQVKPTSYGGIIHGMKAGTIMARDMKNYQKNCKKEVGRDLYLSLLMRKAMDNFSLEDYNKLVSMFAQDKIKRVLETNSRDFPTKFVLDLLVKEPRLMKFAPRVLVKSKAK
tara:strand:- start:385 stop:1464 length:1080 start_codon:yes stop_codon:yes gene_type:complete